MIQLRGREKACEDASGGLRERWAIPQVPPKTPDRARPSALDQSGAATPGALQAPSVAAGP